jgi:preprotein translocase subunit SecY
MDSNLRTRLLWLFGLVLVFKIGVHIPTPGVNSQALTELFNAKNSKTLFGLMNLFSGGALEQLSILGLGISPYISASIIMQLATIMFPSVEQLQKEGEHGRRQITQYTRYLTVGIALIQAFVISTQLQGQFSPQSHQPIFSDLGLGARLLTTLLLATGAVFTMWIGEQITERGIGNGSSILIFVGIASSFLSGVNKLYLSFQNDQVSIGAVILLALVMVAVVAFIVFMEQGYRKVPIQYTRRVVGRNVYGGQESHLPLRINGAGVIPPIFANTLLLFPATAISMLPVVVVELLAKWGIKFDANSFTPSGMLFQISYVTLIVFFCFFYTAITTNPSDLSENLKKSGGYIPGIRPGKATSDFLDSIITRLTFSGAIYIAAVCVFPTILIQAFKVDFHFGGTTLLILVGVALDTISQIQAHLMQQNYDGFLKQARLRGRRA